MRSQILKKKAANDIKNSSETILIDKNQYLNLKNNYLQ